MEYRDAEMASRTHREADWAREMVATQGWSEMARWLTEQARLEADALELGVSSWDDYQRTVGRLSVFREVLARPDELVEASVRLIRGDSE